MFAYNGKALFLVTVSRDNAVSFMVKNEKGEFSLDYVGNNRVAITRFCLKELKKAQESFDYLWCVAYTEDGLGGMRKSVYAKLGFEFRGSYNSTGCPILEWGIGSKADSWKRWESEDKRKLKYVCRLVTDKIKEGYSYVSSSSEELIMEKEGKKSKWTLFFMTDGRTLHRLCS